MSYDYRMAAEKESERFKALKDRLRTLSDEFEELKDQVIFSPATKAALPADYRGKTTWGHFAKAPDECQRISTAIRSLAASLDMAISLAEVVEMDDQ